MNNSQFAEALQDLDDMIAAATPAQVQLLRTALDDIATIQGKQHREPHHPPTKDTE